MLLNNMNLNILKKASPHLDERSRTPITLILKLCELSECVSNLSHSPKHGIESCDDVSSTTVVNTEALLRDIRPECSKPGRDIIDLMLNLSKTKDFYNTYRTLNNVSGNNSLGSLDALKNSLSDEQLTRINEISKLINTN